MGRTSSNRAQSGEHVGVEERGGGRCGSLAVHQEHVKGMMCIQGVGSVALQKYSIYRKIVMYFSLI